MILCPMAGNSRPCRSVNRYEIYAGYEYLYLYDQTEAGGSDQELLHQSFLLESLLLHIQIPILQRRYPIFCLKCRLEMGLAGKA